MTLCAICTQIFRNYDRVVLDNYPIHTSVATFLTSLEEACDVCSWLFRQLPPNVQERVRVSTRGLYPLQSCLTDRALIQWSWTMLMTVSLNLSLNIPRRGSYGWLSLKLEDGQNSVIQKKIFFLALKDVKIEDPAPWQVTSNTTQSSETFCKIRRWVSICDTTHTRCRSREIRNDWYPTRLVTRMPLMSGEWRYRIVEGKNIPAGQRYITLSHRWDTVGRSDARLTTETLWQWMEDLPAEQLSQVFKDAFEVAQRLDVLYVWIDSLCIIQEGDGGVDWSRESPTMHAVYSNAIVNVCASWDGGGGGLFSRRDASGTPQVDVCLEDGLYRKYMMAEERAPVAWETKVKISPLYTRGWVFQEELLSLRNLHFCRDEVLFECFEMSAGETMATSHIHHTWELEHEQGSRASLKRSLSLLFGEVRQPSEAFYRLWGQVLEEYTKRDLTFPSDRLVAISGVAKRFKAALGQDFFAAGLWLSHLATDMLWFVVKYNGNNGAESVIRLPTFSWISAGHHVSMFWASLGTSANLSDIVVTEITCIYYRSNISSNSEINIVEDIFTLPSAPMLEIKVVGNLKRLSLELRNGFFWGFPQGREPSAQLTDYKTLSKRFGKVFLDFTAAEFWSPRMRKDNLFYVPWANYDSRLNIPNLACLVLELVDGQMARFRRIGILIMRRRNRRIYLESQDHELEFPCWKYDEVAKKHTFFII